MITVSGYTGSNSSYNYNAVVSVRDVTDESGVFEEPVSIEEMKDYLRLEGYIDTDESTADELSSFDFDDVLLADMIKGSRQMMEEVAGISMIPKTLEAVLTNMCGMQEIPFGPVGDIVSLYQDDGTTEILAANYTIVGNLWKYIKEPTYKNMIITYETGYDKLPRGLKLDLMRLVAYMYENRGEDQDVQKFAFQLAMKYSRNSPIN